MSHSRSPTWSSASLLNKELPPLLPQGGEVSRHIRIPQAGRQHVFFLRSVAEYAYYLFDEKIPYFSNGYDLHTLFTDVIEEHLYRHSFSGRSYDEQLSLLVDEVAVCGFMDKTELSELRFKVLGLRNDIKRLIRQDIRSVNDYWHINHKLDSSFTAWVVIE